MTGRPSTYSEKMAEEICVRLAEGSSLVAVCKSKDTPHLSTVYKWLDQQPRFAEMYTRALEARADTHADEITAIADDMSIDPQHKRVMIDARKWVAAKLRPRRYGERVTHENSEDRPLPAPTINIAVLGAALRGQRLQLEDQTIDGGELTAQPRDTGEDLL